MRARSGDFRSLPLVSSLPWQSADEGVKWSACVCINFPATHRTISPLFILWDEEEDKDLNEDENCDCYCDYYYYYDITTSTRLGFIYNTRTLPTAM